MVGGGNSGARIAAGLALDGRALSEVATARRRALEECRGDTGGVASLGDVVAVPPVRAARDAGLLRAAPVFSRLTPDGVRWVDGTRARADSIVRRTGFRPALAHADEGGA